MSFHSTVDIAGKSQDKRLQSEDVHFSPIQPKKGKTGTREQRKGPGAPVPPGMANKRQRGSSSFWGKDATVSPQSNRRDISTYSPAWDFASCSRSSSILVRKALLKWKPSLFSITHSGFSFLAFLYPCFHSCCQLPSTPEATFSDPWPACSKRSESFLWGILRG